MLGKQKAAAFQDREDRRRDRRERELEAIEIDEAEIEEPASRDLTTQ